MGESDAIGLERVSRLYPPDVRAIDELTLRVERGEWVTLMGPSGSGKTTLMNLLDGLDSPTSGRVTVLGHALDRLGVDGLATFRREHVGLVFQQFHLVPYLTALENVMVAQYYHSMVDRAGAERALDRVGLAPRRRNLPAQLSGGEKQRVCIARALINDPELVLADEPTGNLDEENENIVLEILRDLHEAGKTLVVATHDQVLAAPSNRTIVLEHGHLADADGSTTGVRCSVRRGEAHPVAS